MRMMRLVMNVVDARNSSGARLQPDRSHKLSSRSGTLGFFTSIPVVSTIHIIGLLLVIPQVIHGFVAGGGVL